MVTKKKTGKKTKPLRKAKLRRKPKYDCGDGAPTKPLGLREIIRKIVGDKEFADFIRRLLCRSNGGDDTATACLKKYYTSNDSDLEALCVKQEDMAASLRCTEQNRLLDAVAYTYGTSRKR